MRSGRLSRGRSSRSLVTPALACATAPKPCRSRCPKRCGPLTASRRRNPATLPAEHGDYVARRNVQNLRNTPRHPRVRQGIAPAIVGDATRIYRERISQLRVARAIQLSLRFVQQGVQAASRVKHRANHLGRTPVHGIPALATKPSLPGSPSRPRSWKSADRYRHDSSEHA